MFSVQQRAGFAGYGIYMRAAFAAEDVTRDLCRRGVRAADRS
jgi:hypothetical protein